MSTLFTGILTFVLALMHPFYISMTDINYNASKKSMEISVRIFTDDFEKTLRKKCNCKVDLSVKEYTVVMNPLVQHYILQHLQIIVNGHAVDIKFKGFEKEEESTWSYFEAQNISAPKTISINNSLLHDYNEEQINMLHIRANGREQTEKLDYPDTQFEVRY